jgi:hypothetical protein
MKNNNYNNRNNTDSINNGRYNGTQNNLNDTLKH